MFQRKRGPEAHAQVEQGLRALQPGTPFREPHLTLDVLGA